MVDWQSVCAVNDVALIPCRDWPGECSESWVDDPHTGQQGRSGATNQVPAGGRVPSQNRGRATQHCAIPTVPAGKGLGVLILVRKPLCLSKHTCSHTCIFQQMLR